MFMTSDAPDWAVVEGNGVDDDEVSISPTPNAAQSSHMCANSPIRHVDKVR